MYRKVYFLRKCTFFLTFFPSTMIGRLERLRRAICRTARSYNERGEGVVNEEGSDAYNH